MIKIINSIKVANINPQIEINRLKRFRSGKVEQLVAVVDKVQKKTRKALVVNLLQIPEIQAASSFLEMEEQQSNKNSQKTSPNKKLIIKIKKYKVEKNLSQKPQIWLKIKLFRMVLATRMLTSVE